MMKMLNKQFAFTLAELLIALAILGVIATFTIPKILDSGSSSQSNAIAKEAAGMISGAFQNYKLNGGTVAATTTPGVLTPYMNYVGLDTVTQIDGNTNGPPCTHNTYNCSGASSDCYKLHNGALLRLVNTAQFNDTSSTSALWFLLDPDGVSSGASNTAGHGVYFFLYTNGRLRSWQTIEPNTMNNLNTYNVAANCDPPWFSWSN